MRAIIIRSLEEGKRRTLGVCTFGIWNEDAYQLWMDADTLKQVLDKLDPNSLRAAKIAEALETFTLAVDFEQDEAGRIASYRAGREALKPALEAKNGSTTPVFYAVGNAHIDLAWLWPMAETHRKPVRCAGNIIRSCFRESKRRSRTENGSQKAPCGWNRTLIWLPEKR